MVSAKGVPLSRWRASKIMKELNIVSCQQLEHRYIKAIKKHVGKSNHLDRQFAVTEPNQTWCGDVTYLWTSKRWAYLAVAALYLRVIPILFTVIQQNKGQVCDN